MSLRRWLACQTLPSATAGVATDLLIVKTILVGATAKISENERTLNDMQNGKRKFMGDIRITFFVSICKLSRFKHVKQIQAS